MGAPTQSILAAKEHASAIIAAAQFFQAAAKRGELPLTEEEGGRTHRRRRDGRYGRTAHKGLAPSLCRHCRPEPAVPAVPWSSPIAYGAAKRGQHVCFATLEVKPSSIAMQFAATLSGIGVRRLAKAHKVDQAEFRRTLEVLRALPIHVHDTRHTLAAITAKARSLQARRPLDLVAIDYLGLIADCDIGDHKPSAVGRVTTALKRLAGELGCVVMVACQLSRLSASEKNREPRLTDLRDSGDIEQDADKVIFIHRPDADPMTGLSQADTSDKSTVPTFFQNLIQAKGRDDGTGLASFYFKRETATFFPAARKAQ
jgi:replicative DNA helicase